MTIARPGLGHERQRAPQEPEFNLADRLRKIRHDVLGMHQSEFATHLGVTKSAYAAWESGRTRPRDVVQVARQIERDFDVAASWTLGTSESEELRDDAVAAADDGDAHGGIPEWTLGWRLQRALMHAGMRADEMGRELGVTRTTISRWVNDHGAPPRTAYVRLWALRTGVPYSWLSEGTVTSEPTDGTHPDRGYTGSQIPDNSS
jgi:transcriptional regulator with XRE-family HTH domain